MRLLLLVVALVGQATTQPPDTEVFLASLSIRGGKVEIGAPMNISNSPGYDNQPSFTPDGAAVLFTSVRGDRKPDPANSAATGSDIYRYDIATGRLSQLIDSPEAEYSPTVTPDGRHISVIRVEADGTQRLWRFAPDGKSDGKGEKEKGRGREPELVLRDVKPVGYHAWVSARLLALFVLGQGGQPATLQVADTQSGHAHVVATGIGRSLQRIPAGGISFVLRSASADDQPPVLTITELDPETRQTRPLVRAPAGATEADTAWTPDGLLLVPFQGQLFGWRRGETEMSPAADLSPLGMRAVTRLAISPKGDRIAFVGQAR
jgi:dipeptidyl aminopeptidase/acylaminoacyl peptidase